MALIAIAIKLDDGGLVIFRQQRVGRDLFRIIKFRTMTVDAEARRRPRSRPPNPRACSTSRPTTPGSPVGRFLRATSLDELPQLFNDAGRIDERRRAAPAGAGEGESVEDFVERRARMKPGVTGLWQVSGRSDLPEEERIPRSLLRGQCWTLVITWRTVRAVLQRRGAY